MEELALHPTVKPVEMIADAIQDAPGAAIVLDLFGGSGSTLIAAAKTGRRARLRARPGLRRPHHPALAGLGKGRCRARCHRRDL